MDTTASQITPSFTDARVRDAMTLGVIACPPETGLRTVARLMSTHRVHCIAVHAPPTRADLAADAIWGIVSDLDLIEAARAGDIDDRTAGTTAASPVVSIDPDAPLERAAGLMIEYATAHLVVVDPATQHPVGVLSTFDLTRTLAAEVGRFDFGPDS